MPVTNIIDLSQQVVFSVISYFDKSPAEANRFRLITGEISPRALWNKCQQDGRLTLKCFKDFLLYVFDHQCYIKNNIGEHYKGIAYDTLALWGIPRELHEGLSLFAFAELFSRNFPDRTHIKLRNKLVSAIGKKADEGTMMFIKSNYCSGEMNINTKLASLTILVNTLKEYYPTSQTGQLLSQLGFNEKQINLLGYSR